MSQQIIFQFIGIRNVNLVYRMALMQTFTLHCVNYRIILANFLVWRFCGETQFPKSIGRCPKLCGNCVFSQTFHSGKLAEITVFYAVSLNTLGKRVAVKVILILSICGQRYSATFKFSKVTYF